MCLWSECRCDGGASSLPSDRPALGRAVPAETAAVPSQCDAEGKVQGEREFHTLRQL